MKIDRLIGILSILLQQEKVTAPYLADKFEVSRRTINRDIEDLCKAGIPLVTQQGQNGGISIMEGYRMERMLLTSSDMQAVLAGLRSLDSVCGTNKYQQLMEKLAVGNSSILASNSHIMIDLSSWYKTTLAEKIGTIQSAIERAEIISFSYYAPAGESVRVVEPYKLVFHWSSWYVWGYCLEKQDYRLFKLNRLQNLENAGDNYERREAPVLNLSSEKIYPMEIQVTALFEPEVKWRLVEEFGMDSFQEQPDGMLLFQFGFTDKENLFSWILSFGGQAELVEPEVLRSEMCELTEKMYQIYKKK